MSECGGDSGAPDRLTAPQHEGVDAEEIKCCTKVKLCFNNQPASTNSHVTSAEPVFSYSLYVKLVIIEPNTHPGES